MEINSQTKNEKTSVKARIGIETKIKEEHKWLYKV